MENCKLHILYSFAAKIVFLENKKEIFCVNTLNALSGEIDLKVEDIKNFEIFVYPIARKDLNLVSYSEEIMVKGESLICNSKNIKIYKLPKNHFILQLNKLLINSNSFDNFDKVEAEGGKIKTLNILPTLAKNGKVEIYEIDGNKPKLKEEYFVKMGQANYSSSLNSLKLLNFFENVMCLDFEKARESLSYSLNDKMTKSAFKNFFGDFTKVLLVNYYENFSVLTLNEKTNIAKVYGAEFANSEISNIYEIE